MGDWPRRVVAENGDILDASKIGGAFYSAGTPTGPPTSSSSASSTTTTFTGRLGSRTVSAPERPPQGPVAVD